MIVCLFHRAEGRRQQTVPSEEVPAGDCQVHQIGAVRAAHVGGALARLCQPLSSAIPGKYCADDKIKENVLDSFTLLKTILQMKEYPKCMEDIESSLEAGYPEAARYKLLERKVKCLVNLGNVAGKIVSL